MVLYISHSLLHKLPFLVYQSSAESSKFQSPAFAPKLKPTSLKILVLNLKKKKKRLKIISLFATEPPKAGITFISNICISPQPPYSSILLGLKIFPAVKGLTATFSPSLAYLHLLFILLSWISQWTASETGLLPTWAPSRLICNCGGCMEELHHGWLLELQTSPSDP